MTSVPDPATPRQAPSDRQQAAAVYAYTFAGRVDAYSVWVPGPAANPEEGHWQAVRKPLSAKVILSAFDTGIPVSGYTLAEDSTTHVAALDIDREDGYELASKFLRHLASIGGIGYIEASRRGALVWMILSERRPATMIRFALRALCREAGLPKDEKIELRPGSDRLRDPEPGEEPPLGHCLRLPTMPHPKTGKRYVMVSSDGEKLGSKLVELIPAIEMCPVSVFEDAAERMPQPEVEVRAPSDLKHPWGRSEKGAYSESMTTILRDLWGVPDVPAPGRGMRCPHPNHPDTNKSAQLHRSDERILCWSPECWINNGGSGRGTIEMTKEAPGRA